MPEGGGRRHRRRAARRGSGGRGVRAWPGGPGGRSAAIRLRGRGWCAPRSMPGRPGGAGAVASCRWPIMTSRRRGARGPGWTRRAGRAAAAAGPAARGDRAACLPRPGCRDNRRGAGDCAGNGPRPLVPCCHGAPRRTRPNQHRGGRSMSGNHQLTDSAELRDALSGVAMSDRPRLEAIMARGRARRRHRLAAVVGLSVAGAAVGIALVLGLRRGTVAASGQRAGLGQQQTSQVRRRARGSVIFQPLGALAPVCSAGAPPAPPPASGHRRRSPAIKASAHSLERCRSRPQPRAR